MDRVADRARTELAALATSGLDVPTFGTAALDVLTRAVPFTLACLAPVDPATRLVTGNLKWGGAGDERDDEWAYYEYEGPDEYNFQTLAHRPGGVSTAMVQLSHSGPPSSTTARGT